MAKLKFKDENNNFIPVVQDVKVNNSSVFDGKDANISLKTINNQNITGSGNIEIDVSDVVKTTANQGLTTQQKLNARNNIEALGSSNIKQGTGTSTTDVISQKGVTDLLAEKQSRVPNGTNPLISIDTGKLDLVYMPATVLGGITNGGTFNSQGIINASSYAPELQGEKIDEVQFASYPSYYFICADNYSFAGFDFTVGDWAISLGNGWAKLNATDAVTSVNGKMGQVVLNADDVQAAPLFFGIDYANKNLVTDYLGMVTTSDYALGQIIVDYYEELPTNVPVTAKASVIKSSGYAKEFTNEEIQESMDEGTTYNDFIVVETPSRPTAEGSWVAVENGTLSLDLGYAMNGGVTEPVFNLNFTDENGISHECYYSYIEQEYAYIVENPVYLQVGWNEILYNEETGEPYVTELQYSDIPVINNVFFTGYEEYGTGFINSFGHTAYHLAGEYIYSQEEPVTNPPTYYWRYSPSNVQSDWTELDQTSLAYVKNKPKLRTNFTTALRPEAEEEITGTINLHKISKTGNYADLRNQVGIKDENNPSGEIFGTYSGTDINAATGTASAAFGSKSEATAHSAFVEGSQNHATGTSSHAEGNATRASNMGSHSEGQFTTASGNSSHAEGSSTIAGGHSSHAEGNQTKALGTNSHAEGGTSEANNNCSHAEGYYCKANGDFGHAEGYATEVKSSYGHAQNWGTIARYCQTAIGKFNIDDTQSTQALIIGDGADNNNRSNLHTVDWSGNAWYKGDIRVGGTSWANATPISHVAKKKNLTNSSQNYSVSNNVVTVTDDDVTASTTDVVLYPADAATETWLENNISSCVITQSAGSFSFNINSSLPATFSMYYIITEVQ